MLNGFTYFTLIQVTHKQTGSPFLTSQLFTKLSRYI